MKKEEFPEDCEKKLSYVKDDGMRWLDATVNAYEAVTMKAVSLLGITVPLTVALLGFIAATYQPGYETIGILRAPAWAYATGVGIASFFLSRAVALRGTYHSGRKPERNMQSALLAQSLEVLLREDCKQCQQDIDDNENSLLTVSGWFTVGLGLFVVSPLVAMFVLYLEAMARSSGG